MRSRVLLYVFFCILLFSLAQAWWSRSGSRSSSSRSSRSNTRSSATRRTTTTRKPSTNRGWFWGSRATSKVTTPPKKATIPPIRTKPTIKPTTKKNKGWPWTNRSKTTKKVMPKKTATPSTPTTKPTTTKNKGWWFGRNSKKGKVSGTKIGKVASDLEGSTDYSTSKPWRKNKKYEGQDKCNLYVYDVLKKTKADPPERFPGLVDPSEPLQEGDIIAFGRKSTSGHVGIVAKDTSRYISAGAEKVENKPIPNDDTKEEEKIFRTTVWRYVE
uniref:Uncharacterized protein LOC111106679 isoform X2 n=1 Tax=Crassostrea virginica TaxID=6565 RepID=A0A8B8B2A3_CRAVI|nr:uncharacterized protein LOC111106679 isoform X2 [Crassostrea virginica]